MNLQAVPAKPELCKSLLQARSPRIRRGDRALLIIIDGVKPLQDMVGAMAALGLQIRDLDRLTEEGLIYWPGGSHAPRGGASPAPLRSLAAAKLHALELIARMLAGRDDPLRTAARQVLDAEQFGPWLDACAEAIAQAAGAERAALFLERVLPLIPDDAAVFPHSRTLDLEL